MSEEKLRYFLKRVTANLHETRQRLQEMEAAGGEPIALVGMACRFPGGVRSPQDLWQLLDAGRESVAALPRDRGWDLGDDGTGQDAAEVQAGNFLHDATGFDPAFFGISPREAVSMDPQQRLLLEVAWEALERSGIDPSALRGSPTGVFAGASASGYGWASGAQGDLDGHVMTGNAMSVLSGRLAYTLGLEGPAVTVDTACSSALVSLHLACQALRAGECSMALVGGAYVAATPVLFTDFSRSLGLSPDGRCQAFGVGADGMGVAEGVGVVVAERLSDARRNGHRVLAVVRGSAVNQDGASNGLTAPNGPAQQRVIRAALAGARLTASEVDVVEAHGTGTPLGDPIEAQALLATYGQERPEGRPLWLGSVKSNIGHAQQAAGMAGIIKMVLALQHQNLPRTLHVEKPTDEVDWSAGEVRLLAEPVPWPSGERVRRAGVSGFGMSGTNVHVILEEAPAEEAEEAMDPAGPDGPATDAGEGEAEAQALAESAQHGPDEQAGSAPAPALLADGGPTAWLVSGRSAEGLVAQAGRLREWAAERPALRPADVAWSLAATRSVFEHRGVVVADEHAACLSGLDNLAAATAAGNTVVGVARAVGRTVFVFAGQGAQWVGMGRELLGSSPLFGARLAECEVALAPYVDWSLTEVLAGVEGAPALEAAEVVQPALWAVMVSLAAVWEAAGVTPDAVVGHSQGEIAAATVAGMLSLEDAARVVAVRSRALSALDVAGAMVSVVMPADAVRELVADFDGRLSVAAVNGPASVVVSGQAEALAAFERELAARKVLRWRIPATDFVAHSAAVEPLAAQLEAELSGIVPQAGRVPMVSTVTGEWLAGEAADAAYWFANLRQMVRFEEAVRTLLEAGYGAFVEVSPHPVLTAAVTETAEDVDSGAVQVLSIGTLSQTDAGAAGLLRAFAQAHVAGLPVDWRKVLPTGEVVELPTYAFQHRRYWLEPSAAAAAAAVAAGGSSAAEARFWAAVEGGDLTHMADVLNLDDAHALGEVLPALTSWRRQEQDRSATADWRYHITWAPVADPAAAVLTGRWLLLTGPEGTGPAQACAQALAARGADTTIVEVPAGTVDRAAMAAVLGQALQETTAPSGIVSLLALDETPVPGHPAVPGGLAGTLAAVQALGDTGVEAPLWVLTRGAVATTAQEPPVTPAQSLTWGFGRVVALEHPDRWGGLIDLPADFDGPDGADGQITARLCAVLAGCGEDQTAIRPAGIFGRRLSRAGRPRDEAGPYTPGGSALVTGGTGAIGGRVARWLSGRGAARLVLTSRSGPAAAGAAVLAAELAAAGSRVDIVACDVSDRAQVATVLGRIAAQGPSLTTVLHTAGVNQATLVQDTDLAETDAVLAAKTAGARHLHDLTRELGLELDAFILFSSISATWGSGLQPAYAAANTYLDGLAQHRRAHGLPATSVAWGSWGGGGMTDEVGAAQGIRRGLIVMDPDHAVQALAQILDCGEPQMTVAHVDWQRFAPPFTLRRPSPLIENLPEVQEVLAADGQPTPGNGDTATGPQAGASWRRQLAGLSRTEQKRTLLTLVQTQAAAVLDYAAPGDVEATRAFSDLGFDSLTSVELRNRLSSATGLHLPATLLFDAPTPSAAAEFLLAELAELTGTPDGTQADASRTAPVLAAAADEPLAIVGMACRYPGGASGPQELWNLITAGTDAISVLPEDRGWDIEDRQGDPQGPVRSGGFVYDATHFDAGFFGISPREAVSMDPQQRLLLEVAWEALERSGIDPSGLRGSPTGVFAGASASGYGWSSGVQKELDGHLVTGISTSVVSGRVSYVLGLEGPAVTVDTACSSSLVALHMACQALRSGECSLALAGGVMVAANPLLFDQFSRQMGLSPDGRCKPFGAGADGMGLGEGAGMLVVERLSDARRHGHKVLAVVRGSAVNQDGASNGLTAPNGPSQQRVIRAALANARLTPADVDVVEAHGTGTPLGDPIEAQALLATYGQDRGEGDPLWLGSVKSNIGHTQAAAGVAGVIKMVQALQHRELPRTLHAAEPSPHIDWSAGDVRLLTEAAPWPGKDRVRRAGVSSFGMSGTNAHLILEEAPAETADAGEAPEPAEDGPAVLAVGGASAWLVSGRSAEGLAAQAGRLGEWAAERPALRPVDVAWSLAATRAVLEHRGVVVAGGREGLLDGARGLAAGESAAPGVVSGVARATGRTVFVFAGQGAQWVGMGRELLGSSPLFAARLAECEAALAPYVDWSLTEVLAGAGDAPALEAAEVVQPTLWAVMVSLAAVWEAAGIVPDAVVGHSQGEIAAATVAGMLSLEDAARVVAVRSRALSGLDVAGAMVSVVMPAGVVRELVAGFDGRLSVAAVNGPASVVVSGQAEALAAFERELAARKVLRWRIPATDFVAHSAAVEPLAAQLEAELSGVVPQAGRIPMVSTVTGQWLAGEEVNAEYWFANLRQTVRFEDAVRSLLEAGYGAFVEVSPHPVLTAAVSETAEDADAGAAQVLSIGTLSQSDAGAAGLLRAFAQAHVAGLPVDWRKVLPTGEVVELPTYAFQHRRYWLEASATTAAAAVAAGGSSAAEAQFWAAVEGGDLSGVADTLALTDQQQLSGVLPALASWRRREQERSATEGWRYRITWAPVADPAPARLTGRWLLLVPASEADGPMARQCRAALTARGADVVVLEMAGAAAREAVAEQTRAALPTDGFAGILSLLALDETPMPDYPSLTVGLAATLALVQGLGDADVNAPLWVATSQAVAAAPGEPPVRPLQTQVWGLGRVVGLEHPERWGGLIDLPADFDGPDGQIAARLGAVLAGYGGEDQVAIRAAAILGRRLTHAPQPALPDRPWTPGGSVLVTGGTGAIGGHVARWAAGRGARRLVLTSRSGPAAAGAAALAAELAAAGSRVDIVACDVSDRAQVAGTLGRIVAQGPLLTTVLHTAGIGQAVTVAEADLAETDAVLAAKAAGARHLDELTRELGLELDAFVLFSSISAIWGSVVQPAYAAANTYLDGLAEQRRARGLPATSVAWGPWGGGGMTDAETAGRLARGGVALMDKDRAVQALAHIVDGREGPLTIVDVDWSRFAVPFTLRRPSPLIAGLPEAAAALAAEAAVPATDPAAGASLREELAGLPSAEQHRALVRLVQEHAAAVLDYAVPGDVEATRAFSDLGFDSLTSVELRNRLSSATGLQLPATLLFDHPTPQAAADHLWSEQFQDGTGAVSLVEEVDRLGSLLTGAAPDEKTYDMVTERLHHLLAQWKESGAPQESQAVADKIGSATDDEIFEFIHRELGR
ncbi:type I polyketide synthase [Streptomyces paromomycinus]|uniref:Polyketide synthase n=1 Tax=Streptomyces paromomycinus TaxID=92743 RepID=A0A401WE34_STREY|nr:type I polyketide synthase [Streptomyces paromomycinus]GCD47593.1 polyketide synthase [Streptomyces paromomycinus]